MNTDLFQIPQSAPTPLQQARARLLRAQQSVARLELIYDSHGEMHPVLKEANHELKSAANSCEVEENREIERTKQPTESKQ